MDGSSRADSERWLRTVAERAEFRARELTPEKLLDALKAAYGRLLITLDVGTGKTVLLDRLIAMILATEVYDLVVYLVGQLNLLAERPWLAKDPSDNASPYEGARKKIVVLAGRPRERCGPDRDRMWQSYLDAGCTRLGREDVCGTCPQRAGCQWPDQLSEERLAGAKVIVGAQAFMKVVPGLMEMLQQRTGAQRPLLIMDEGIIIEHPYRAQLPMRAIEQSLRVARRAAGVDDATADALAEWIRTHEALLDPSNQDLNLSFPGHLEEEQELLIQRLGWKAHGPSFRFLGHEFAMIARSRRWRTSDGSVEYVRRPLLRSVDYVLASAGLPLDLARERLGDLQLQEFCPGVRLLDEGTQVFNICCAAGSTKYFPKNAPQILFATAQMVVRLDAEGKRTVVVGKKCFAAHIQALLQGYLRELSGKELRVVHGASEAEVQDPLVVPLLTYGVRGVNLFEEFHAAIAVCSFNAREDVLDAMLNDTRGPDARTSLAFGDFGGKRVARPVGPRARWGGEHALTQGVQHQFEAAWAEQVLGRVRFASRPRLVIFFQRGPLRFPLTAEFRTLPAFRSYFGLLTRRQWQHRERAALAQEMIRSGASVATTAGALGVDRRTVFRLKRASR